MRELTNESEGLDIKLGPGGIEEIEFYVQYLELQYSGQEPGILHHNTLQAVENLTQLGAFSQPERTTLCDAYNYYRKLETFLRLNEEQVIIRNSEVAKLGERFMGHKTTDEFISHLGRLRDSVLSIVQPDDA